MIPRYLIVHHSLTADGQTVSWGAIRKYHTDPVGPYRMLDIGYHFGLELVGDHYEVLMGRMPNQTGAHCTEEGMNRQSLGICVVGNYDVSDLPEDAFELLVKLTRALTEVFSIPAANVQRHSDYAPKSCPGKRFPWERFKQSLW